MKLNLRSIDLNLLTVFDALMDAGKLSLAAERLGMSQPAVSAALQRLRHTFNDDLFLRTRSGMLPTPRAESLHEDIREALQLVRRAVTTEAAFDPRTSERSFTVLSDIFFESTVVGSLLNRFRTSAPEVCIETASLQQGGSLQALRSLNADVMLDYEHYQAPQLSTCQVGVENLVVMVARNHPRMKRAPSLEAFLRESHVILTRRHGPHTSLEYALGGTALERRVRATVQHFSSMPIIVSQTQCLAVVPQRLGSLYEEAFAVRCFRFPLDIEPIPLWMYWPRAMDKDPAHRWFRKQLVDVLN